MTITTTNYTSITNYYRSESQKQKDFAHWESSSKLSQSLILEKTTGSWGRLRCEWKEGEKLHQYAPVVNLKNGDLYLDCSPQKTLCKMATHLIARPLLTLAETLLAITGIFYEVVESLLLPGPFNCRDFFANQYIHLSDAVRTPLYGVAMMITSLVGVILFLIVVPFSNTKATSLLFDWRKLTGDLELVMHRGKHSEGKASFWHGSKRIQNETFCFKPCNNVTKIDLNNLSSIAQLNIETWRLKSLCWRGGKLSPDEIYISPVLAQT